MKRTLDVHRVVLVVLDGLRPDAIAAFELAHVGALAVRGLATGQGRTVTPSITAAAMATLLTGVPPCRHGVVSDRFHIPRRHGRVDPLPHVLAAAGHSTDVFIGELPYLYRGLTTRIARYLGITRIRSAGARAIDILAEARTTLRAQRSGLVVLHWPDADQAGHAHGWMSTAYGAAARALDAALGELVDLLQLDDARTLLIALADHGGGGRIATDHESDTAADNAIPIILAGAGLVPGELADSTGLIDVPLTILDALGVPAPLTYEGRSLIPSASSRRLPPRGAGLQDRCSEIVWPWPVSHSVEPWEVLS